MEVRRFVFDERNEEKITGHGIRLAQLEQLLESRFALVANRKQRRATQLLIGRDYGGQAITTPLVPFPEPGVWYPVTAWYSKPFEQTILERVESGP